LTEKILHKNENPQTPIKFRQNKTEKDLTIDTDGEYGESTGEISFFLHSHFSLTHTERGEKNVESSSPLCRLSCFTFIVLENDVA
jgi:hypothetical protein